ncbi:MAG: hypothetical protein AAGD00_08590 [Planctomycetota bacterium]
MKLENGIRTKRPRRYGGCTRIGALILGAACSLGSTAHADVQANAEASMHIARLSTQGMIAKARTTDDIESLSALDSYLDAAAVLVSLRDRLLSDGSLLLDDASLDSASADAALLSGMLEGLGIETSITVYGDGDESGFRVTAGSGEGAVSIEIGPSLVDWLNNPLHHSILEQFGTTAADIEQEPQFQQAVEVIDDHVDGGGIQPGDPNPINPTDNFQCTSGQDGCSVGNCTSASCTSGSCTGSTGCTQINCTFANSCTQGGQCTLGGSCTAGSDCTAGDWCTGGGFGSAGCTGGSKCTKGGGCTQDDSCTSNPFACTSGTVCTGGPTCTSGVDCTSGSECTGGDVCTSDASCSMGGCTQASACTGGPSCSSGAACTSGQGNRTCTELGGCSDGACTSGGGCSSQSCTNASTCWTNARCPTSGDCTPATSGSIGLAVQPCVKPGGPIDGVILQPVDDSIASLLRTGTHGAWNCLRSDSSLASCAWLVLLAPGLFGFRRKALRSHGNAA